MSYSPSALRTCTFSFFKKNYFATCGDEGMIIIWDINKQELYHAFEKSKHSKPCHGVAFSPTNELLLCSGGLDSKI
jgi:WD40 repeat protein